MPFLMLFLCIPLIEIATFIMVGGAIGAVPTILLVIASALLGSFVIQNQGINSFETTQRALREGYMPQINVFTHMCGVLAGLLLIIPGFFTDILALALLVPVVRAALRRRMARFFGVDPAREAPGVIAGEYEIVVEETTGPVPPQNPRLPDLKP